MLSRRFSRIFSLQLRTLFLFITIVCVLLGVLVTRAKRRAECIAALRASGARVIFEFEVSQKDQANVVRRYLRRRLGPEFFEDVHQIDLLGESAIRANALQRRAPFRPDELPFPPPTTETLMPMTRLKSIKCLKLRESGYYLQLAEISLTPVAHLKQLERLEIHVEGVSDSELRHLRNLKKLTHLNFFGDVTEAGLRHLTELKKLETLSISRRGGRDSRFVITDHGARNLGELGQLRSLEFVHYEVTDDGVINLSQLANLEELDLSGNQISNRGARHLGQMTGLRKLNLNNTKISDLAVCEFAGLVNLESLALCGTDISDECLRVVSRLPSLRELYVSRTELSDRGIQELAASTTIQVLDISYCKSVGDNSIGSLQRLPLWSLNTIGTSVSDQGKRTLGSAIPTLKALH